MIVRGETEVLGQRPVPLPLNGGVWTIGGMIVRGETEVLGQRPVPLPLTCTTNITWTDLGSNPGINLDLR